jgi:hypothetical protein
MTDFFWRKSTFSIFAIIVSPLATLAVAATTVYPAIWLWTLKSP